MFIKKKKKKQQQQVCVFLFCLFVWFNLFMSALLQNLATLKQNWRHTQLLDSTRNLASAHVLDTAVLSCVRDLQLVALADFVSRTHNI